MARKRKAASNEPTRYVLRLGLDRYVCRDGGRLWFSPDVADAEAFPTDGEARQFLVQRRRELPALGRVEVVGV